MFLAKKNCCDKIMSVATKHVFCHNKNVCHNTFVMTNTFVATIVAGRCVALPFTHVVVVAGRCVALAFHSCGGCGPCLHSCGGCGW